MFSNISGSPSNWQNCSNEQCLIHIEDVKSSWLKRKIVLILSPDSSPQSICSKLDKQEFFNGIFVLDNFSKSGEQRIEFKLVNPETPIKVIKEQISSYLDKKISDIALTLSPTSEALKDDDDCLNTLNFHGLGGEIIHIRNLSNPF